MTGNWRTVLGMTAILAVFLITLYRYGDTWLVPWHDEVVIARLAQNFADGQGFCNDLLENILPGAEKRTYWQMPVYPLALSLWGKLFGFELNALRWFSRCAGVIALLLLFALAHWLRLPLWLCLFAVLWTASDLTFQFASNFARPEILCCCFLLASTIAFMWDNVTSSLRHFFVGILMTVAVFTHPIAFPIWLVMALVLIWRRDGRSLALFSVPLFLGAAAWLFYAAQDWQIFLTQMRAHFAHKHYAPIVYIYFLLGTTFWGVHHYLGVPLNAVLWLVPLILTFWMVWWHGLILPRWLLAITAALYGVVALGVEAWYPALFAPFGYLLLAALLSHLSKIPSSLISRPFPLIPHPLSLISLLIAFLLWGYQVSVVARHWQAAPKVRQEVTRFHKDLSDLLPSEAVLLVGSFSPDPTFHLLRHRPDVRLYQIMPLPMMSEKAFRKLRPHLTHLLMLKSLTKVRLLNGRPVKTWRFDFGGLTNLRRHNGITVVLLKRGE